MSTRLIPYRERPETIAARAAWLRSRPKELTPTFSLHPRTPESERRQKAELAWFQTEEGIAFVKAGRPLNWQWPPPQPHPQPTIHDTLKEIERQTAANGLAIFVVILILAGWL